MTLQSSWNDGVQTFIDLLSDTPTDDLPVAQVYPGGWSEYQATWRAVGVQDSHIQRFTDAGIIVQPKQLEFLYWARQADFDNQPDEIGFGGARGGGKSIALFVQAAIDDCQRFPGLKVLYLRKIGKRAAEQMQDMVLKTLSRVPHIYTRDQIKFPNGSRIIIGHFKTENEAMSYLGIEYDVIIVEETTTLSLHAYKHIRLAARSSKGWRPRIYNSTNPMGVGHAWYKKRFIDPERLGEALALGRKFIFATVQDNVFVYHGYIKQLEDLVGAEKRAYLHGDWDIVAGAYFENWNYTRHVIDPFTTIDPGWTIWASMDYGFHHPNVILLHAQDQDGNKYTFHELAHRRHYPIEIAADYRAILELYKIEEKRVHPFVVGNDAFNETGQNKLSIARQYQQNANITLYRADTSPGSRILSAQYIMQLLGNPDRDIPQRLWITKNCRQLIESLPYIQRDPNNLEAPLKVDIDEGGDGGDDCFVAGTLITTYFGNIPIERLRIGDFVLTRTGYKPVKDIWSRLRNRPTVKALFSDHSSLNATPNHPLWISNKWRYLDTLRYGDIISTTIDREISQCLNQKLSFLMGLNSDVIQNLQNDLIGSIIGRAEIIAKEELALYIKKSGNQYMEKSLKDIVSIILMEILSIMILPIFKSCHDQDILAYMGKTRNTWRHDSKIWIKFARLLSPGIAPKQAINGIVIMPKLALEIEKQLNVFANNAMRVLLPKHLKKHDFAVINANLNGDVIMDWMIFKKNVQYAINHLPLADMIKPNTAPKHVLQLQDGESERVYTVHIQDQHEYYANGVLVKNCFDALRYGLYKPKRSSMA